MHKTVIINPTKCTPGSTIASSRIATFLADLTGGHLMHSEDTVATEAETVIVVNGLWGFCAFRDQAWSLIERATKVIYVANDYAITTPKAVKTRPYLRLANYDNADGHAPHVYINWNKLTFNKTPANWMPRPTSPNIFYFGAHREDRITSFKKYFTQGQRPYGLSIGTSAKAWPKFQAYGRDIDHLKDIDPMVTPSRFAASLYLEDDTTHTHYHSPANRYYEMLSSGTFILFDGACRSTFERTGINIDPWIVNSPNDIMAALMKRSILWPLQRSMLADNKNFRLDLEIETRALLTKIGVM